MAGNSADLGERTAALASEASAWVGGNGVDILIATGAGIVIALLLIGLRSLGCRMASRMAAAPQWSVLLAKVVARTNIFFIVMCSAQLVAEHAETPAAILRVIHILFVIAAAIQGAIWARELILGYISQRAGVDDEHSTLASALSIIRLLVTVALFAIAIILILSNLGVNVTGLVAGLGIGGIAIGLAAQGIFSDLFAALSIIFDKPFRRGETITFGNPPMTGTVERIGLKSTRIRAVNGEEVIMSNANLLNALVQNWTRLQRRRALMVLQLVYRTPVEVLAQLPNELRAIVERQPLARFDRAHVTAFNVSSIDVELVFFVEASDLPDFLETRQAVMLAILRRFAELDVEFAYPTQTSFTAGPDGRHIMPYPHVRMIGECDPE
jgi:small-conductance mechanosensitive channel